MQGGMESIHVGESTGNEPENKAKRQQLEQWLNKFMRIRMTDRRTLIGIFLGTDCDCNIIMGSCEEYLNPPDSEPKEDPRSLGLAMIPGKHVVSIEIDETQTSEEGSETEEEARPLTDLTATAGGDVAAQQVDETHIVL